MNMKKETRWVIIGSCGLYVGQSLTRKEAIVDHVKMKGCAWSECKKRGDKCVKATITYITK